jgi:hypothetical protein
MNTFTYDSLDQAVESAGGYATWVEASGTNTISVVLALLAIAVSVIAAVLVTVREDKLLNHAADRLSDKYNTEG